jgi:hypothetical protein
MAQSFTDFRALPVGDFVSSDFVNTSGTGVIEDNSYPQGNALVCGGSTWSGVVQVGLLHQADVEVSVVCASTGSGQIQRAILVYSATADGYLTGSADYIAVRWFSDVVLAQGVFSGSVDRIAADGDILTLRVTELSGGGVRAACLINGVEQFAADILAADVPAPDGDGNYYTSFTNRNGKSNSGIYSYGIGTDGDAAPTSPVVVGPVTPVNPSITNLLATSARLNWEQG